MDLERGRPPKPKPIELICDAELVAQFIAKISVLEAKVASLVKEVAELREDSIRNKSPTAHSTGTGSTLVQALPPNKQCALFSEVVKRDARVKEMSAKLELASTLRTLEKKSCIAVIERLPDTKTVDQDMMVFWEFFPCMLDPVMLFVVGGAVFSMLVVLSYFFFSREDGDFEKAYNSSALALLTESEKKEKKGGEKAKKTKKKAEKTEKNEKKTVEKEVKEEKVAEVVEKVEKVQKVEKIAEIAAVAPVPKKKAPKPVNIKELDQKKVIARLSALADLEDGYIQYLTGAFRDSDLQKNNLSAEVKALNKKLADASHKIEKANKEKSVVEQREKNEIARQATLAAKLQALTTRDSELVQSIQTAQNALHSHQEAHSKEAQQFRLKTQQLEAEIQNLKATNQKLAQKAAAPPPQPVQNTAENARLHEKIAELNGQIQKFEKVAKEMEAHHEKKIGDYLALSQEAAHMEKAISELEETLATSRRELVVQTEREAKKDQLTRALEEEKKKMTEEYHKLKALVDGLNKDVDEFHVYKKEQEQLVDEMKQREAAREQQLVAIQKELEAEKSRIVEIPANSTESEQVVEEVFELKKTTNDLAVAPSTSGVEQENCRLKEKNEELRQRNYTLLEKTENGPKQLAAERKLVVAEVGKLAVGGKAFKKFDDEAAYISWIQETITSSQKKAPEVTSSPKVESGNEGECRKALKSLLTQLETIGKLAEKQENELRSLKA